MKFNKDLAPIVLFVYNRLDHTQLTIESLQKNILAEESELYIYSDAAKNNNSSHMIQEVRNYLKSVNGFKKITIIERKKNFGLAASIIDGVSSIINEYGKVIVLEDDLVTSPYFLQFMNDSLDNYKETKDIFSITGFSFSTKFMNFPKSYLSDIYFHKRPMSWSWATWSDRWSNIDWDVKDYDSFKISIKQQYLFNRGGPDLTRMLKNQMNGKLDSWYIRWSYNAFKQNKYTVYPKISYVNNIGHDNSGVHCSTDEDMIYSHTELNQEKVTNFPKEIKLVGKILNNFNKAFKIKVFQKIKEKLIKIFKK